MPRRKGPSLDRSQVIDAAITLVEAEGADALTMSRVARALGIKPPSLYNHVANGEALAFALTLEGSRRQLAAFRAAIRGVYDPEQVLLALADCARRWARDNPGLYAVMSRTPPQNEHPEFLPILEETLELFRRPLAQLGVVDADAIHAIRALRAGIHGFVLLETSGQFGLPDAIDASYAWLVQTTLRGLPRS